MKTLDEVKAIIADSSYWVYDENKYTVHLLNTTIKYLTHDELALVDPRLPYLIQALPAVKTVGANDYKDGFTVYITTQYWDEIDYTIVDTSGETLVLAGIEKIDDVAKKEAVIFHAHTYELLGTFQIQVAGGVLKIPYAANIGYRDNEISRVWLEENLPNWKAAWEALLALGIDDKERHIHLLASGKPNSTYSHPLPEELNNI